MAPRNVRKRKSEVPVRDRIMSVAKDLFYRQGYRATGINQIIRDSGVAKASFYDHFSSKEALCVSYLRQVSAEEFARLRESLAACKTPLARYLHLLVWLEPWLVENRLKGCGFLNIVPEVVDPKSPVRLAGKDHYRMFEEWQAERAQELIDSNPGKYAGKTARRMAREYLLVMAGALTLVELYHDIQPIRDAIRTIRGQLE